MIIVDSHIHLCPGSSGLWQSTRAGRVRVAATSEELQALPPSWADSASPPERALAYMDWLGDLPRDHPPEPPLRRPDRLRHRGGQALAGSLRGFRLGGRGQGRGSRQPPRGGGRGGPPGSRDRAGGGLAFNPDFSFLGEAEMAVWARLDALHRPLALHLSGGERGVREAGEVRQLLERFPNLDVVILHIGWPDKVLDATWQKRVLLAKHDWVHLDLAALPVAFNAEGYPYPGGCAALRWSIDQVGADKIMWGPDYPLVRKYCTYPRALEFLRGPGSGLTEDEQAAIFGDNATRLLADWESR